MLLKTRRGRSACATQDAAVSGGDGWQLVAADVGGQVLVPTIGLRATKAGLDVVRPGYPALQSWPWARVNDLRVGSVVPHSCGEAHRLVGLDVEGRRHLFMCSASELDTLRYSLKRHAPRLCAGVPVDDTSRVRRWHSVGSRGRLAQLGIGAVALLLLVGGAIAGTIAIGSAGPAAGRTSGASDGSIMAHMAHQYGDEKTIDLAAATATPAPSPPSLAGAPVLKPHEIFGFAPYWTLPQASNFDVSDFTTLAYFSIDINGDGSIDRSGSGWVGYESEDLAQLITRAHEAGVRVVLTTTCFSQSNLDALASNPAAPATLAASLVELLGAKNLDGVNFDFEGQGSQDQGGLDRFVSQVSTALKGANPQWQVTMDTYASAAGDPNGFYDIAGLAQSVDAFFVMAYDMDNRSAPSPTAALTGPGFTDTTALAEYTSVVPASKVILGVPYYGYDWPTAGPAQGDPATGGPSPVSYAQVVAGAHPVYWAPVTQTPWTSYQVGTQWHQTWFDDATSLALKAQLANSYHIAGLGVWALGMDGNDPSMIAALLGNAPVVKNFQPAPTPAIQDQAPAASGTSQPGSASAPTSTTNPSSSDTTGQNGLTSPGSTTTTTTTTPSQTGYSYTGTWENNTVTLNLLEPVMELIFKGQVEGQLTDFSTNDPAYSCLQTGQPLAVYQASGVNGLYVVEASTPSDCAEGIWQLLIQVPSGANDASLRSTASSTTTTTTPSSTTTTTTTTTLSGSTLSSKSRSAPTSARTISALRVRRFSSSRRLLALL